MFVHLPAPLFIFKHLWSYLEDAELVKELKKSLSMFDWDEMERLLDNASIDA